MFPKVQTLAKNFRIFLKIVRYTSSVLIPREREKKNPPNSINLFQKKAEKKISAFFRRASALLTKLLTPPAENRHRQRYRTY